MGSYAGHVDEATFFIVMALWWMFNSFPAYIRACWQGEPFRSQLSYAWPGKPKLPIESILKVLFPVAGFMAELFIDGPHFVDENNRITGLNHLQHMSIYGLFIIHGFIDLMYHWGAPLPRGFSHLSMALSFFWYGLSFRFHEQMHGKEGMESMIHLLPTYALFGIAMVLVLEVIRPSWFLAHLTRIFCVLMLGSWFWHTTDMMYLAKPFPGGLPNPKWDHEDPHNVHFLVALFGFHMIMHLVAITVFYLFAVFVMKVRGEHKPQFRQMTALPNGLHGAVNGKLL